jgi:hypothetical protein
MVDIPYITKPISSDTDEEEQSAHPKRPEWEGREVIVELADGSVKHVPTEESYMLSRKAMVWVDGKYITSPPVRVHIPVETKTAAYNNEQKSEQEARMPRNIVRYSPVLNGSARIDMKDLNLAIPYYEIWFARSP